MLTSKKGRKPGSKALKLGGVAAVGAPAYTAYQRYNNKGATSPLPVTASATGFLPEDRCKMRQSESGSAATKSRISSRTLR
ncbi:tellurite resistance TerB family protein [Desulfopila sp. IMCC35006]|nr:tellurite resistance TerB family protein [Desulfopila sp. IMCC35006]